MTKTSIINAASPMICLLAATLLAGCMPAYSWRNARVAPSSEERQFKIDSAECTVIAMRAVPLEQRQNYPTLSSSGPAQSYAISGTTTTYDANGNIYAGQYHGTAIANSNSSDFNTSFARGEASAQMAQDDWRRNQAYRTRDSLAEACLMRRGWQKARPK